MIGLYIVLGAERLHHVSLVSSQKTIRTFSANNRRPYLLTHRSRSDWRALDHDRGGRHHNESDDPADGVLPLTRGA
jgi:hypothetical protein